MVVIRNLTEDGNADSWTCPLVLLATRMLGPVAGDEDPLPPDGANPHPLPIVHDDFWHGDHMVHNDDMDLNEQANQAAHAEPGPGHGQAAPAAEEQIVDVAPMTPPQVNNNNTEEDIIEIIQSVEPVSALKGLINSIVGNADDILPRLHGYQITAADCNVIDLDGSKVGKRRCYLQIDIDNPNAILDNADISESTEDTALTLDIPTEIPNTRRKKKGKNKAPVDVSSVRRSDRIAGFKLGFYDTKSAAEAKQSEDNMNIDMSSTDATTVYNKKVTAIRPNGEIRINLETHFEAEVINQKAAPPPHLPIETIQTIGTSHCKLPSAMVTKEILEDGESDDSV
jgi:hypothetical protein